eukprot:gb/GECH01009919.1/.p1 GENE.gb/GECH01009919.1/~~gb/GECH01009919.1/.p1  ORF type:complete len:237 (+),score=76.35 gb/GECH01009919.1/:1-711(+)
MAGKPGQTTEWDDIQRRLGNYPELEVTEEDIQNMVDDAVQNYDPLERKTLEQLDEMEDDEDDEVLQKYREQRIKEMKERQAKERYGEVRHISSHEYISEVSEAPNDIWIVLHLYMPGNQSCDIMQAAMEDAAARNKQIKFLKGKADEIIRNFPERNCPCLLIYNGGQVKKQLVGLAHFRGEQTTGDDLEWCLYQLGATETELEDNPRALEKENEGRTSIFFQRGSRNMDSDSDDDW